MLIGALRGVGEGGYSPKDERTLAWWFRGTPDVVLAEGRTSPATLRRSLPSRLGHLSMDATPSHGSRYSLRSSRPARSSANRVDSATFSLDRSDLATHLVPGQGIENRNYPIFFSKQYFLERRSPPAARISAPHRHGRNWHLPFHFQCLVPSTAAPGSRQAAAHGTERGQLPGWNHGIERPGSNDRAKAGRPPRESSFRSSPIEPVKDVPQKRARPRLNLEEFPSIPLGRRRRTA